MEKQFTHHLQVIYFISFLVVKPYSPPNPPPWISSWKWPYMNEGQKRFSYEQWMLSLIRRELPIDHPFPGDETDEQPLPSTPSAGTSRQGT